MLKLHFDSQRDNFSGNVLAPVEIMQYGDYQCMHCIEVHPVIRALQEVMGTSLRYVFRNFPLPRVHYYALESAVAAEAAGRQGRFWPMHNLILQNPQFLTHSSYSWFAEELRLDMQKFEEDRQHQSIFRKITGDLESGIKSGVDGTPTFFINGKRYGGFNDFRSLHHTCLYLKGSHKEL